MEVINDNNCSWVNDLIPRTKSQSLKDNHDCEWLIVGAGYTGLSTARKLAELNPNQKIIFLKQAYGDIKEICIKFQKDSESSDMEIKLY